MAGYCYGDSTSGQRAVYGLGLSGIPIVNVNNNCATGSSALMLAREWVSTGTVDVALAVGFEQMANVVLASNPNASVSVVDRHTAIMREEHGVTEAPLTPQLFATAAIEHMERYGTTAEQIASVAVKNHRHSVNNPLAQFRDEYTLEQVLGDREIRAPITRLQCSPTSDGAGAAVVVSERFVREHGLDDQAVEMVAMTLATDDESTFADRSMIEVVGSGLSRSAAAQAFEQAGIGVEDIDVLEVHDCFSVNEILTYEAFGMCAPGEGGPLAASGATTFGGRWVVNPSGGLISKGHPLGATGLAQCAEISWQLRGLAGARQVDGARVGLQHNVGIGGACVVGVYRGPGA
jgi:acetyl-CoA acetyltransferase